MIDFVKRLFGQSGSSATAKERLRLVLLSDHLSLAPELIDQMKHDLVEVISRYVQVDKSKIEVGVERQDASVALMANIPIVSVHRPSGGTPTDTASPPIASPPAPSTASASVAAAPNVSSPGLDRAAGTQAQRRKRRRKGAAPGAPAPAVTPAHAT